MAMTKVWNDNGHPHKEMFKGREVVIPPGEYLEMEYEEAVEFKGQYTPLPPAEFNGDESIYYKKIRVEPVDPKTIVPDEGMVNHASGKRFTSKEEFLASLDEMRGLLVKDPDAERAVKAPSAEVEALKAELAELRALVKGSIVLKKGPGRPKKDATA